jgi:hypothetical protein
MTDASLCKPRYRNDLTAEKVRALLDYDPETGIFTWRVDRARRKIRAGDVAGSINGHGYVHIGIRGAHYKASRLAWLWVTSEWPKEDLDHINRVKDDDRWVNLREATRSQNAANKPRIDRDLPQGVRLSRSGKFNALITGLYLGTFNTAEEAGRAYTNAAQCLFGEFYSET